MCVEEDMIRYAADEVSIGNLHFFLAQCYMRLGNFSKAKLFFDECLLSHWADSQQNRFLIKFSIAKNFQCLKMHNEAISVFNEALQLRPNDPYCLFRRAWSFKVLNKSFHSRELLITFKHVGNW